VSHFRRKYKEQPDADAGKEELPNETGQGWNPQKKGTLHSG
jgi:hypothetical protein